MTAIKRYINSLKLNKNKKGFTLVELLVAVAIIAVVTPFLVNGFIYATKLNYRSRLQQRADAAANEVYEGIASVKYEELDDYLSSLNGWTPIDDGTGDGYEYYVSKKYDGLEDCEVKVAVQKYSEAYIVPDLNFVGVESKYLTLASEINSFDSVVSQKIEQEIKSDADVKLAIKQDIIAKIRDTYGKTLLLSEVDASKILVDCGDIDKNKISKETSVYLDIVGEKFVASYETSYRYPALVPNPDVDDASLAVAYTYAHNLDGKWISVSNESLDVQGALRSYYNDPALKFQLRMSGASDSASVKAEKKEDGTNAGQTIFIYYDPVSKMDWVDLRSGLANGWKYNVFFIEQTSEENGFLYLDTVDARSTSNNFAYSGVPTKPTNDYTILPQGITSVDLYSNNKSIASNGIPDAIYESSEAEATMYRVNVTVTYKSEVFADVSGNFQAGGGTVGNYQKGTVLAES